MYMCCECYRAFDEPDTKFERVRTDLGDEIYTTKMCPYCRGEYAEADRCTCGNVKFKGDVLCYDCRRVLAAKFALFMDGMTAEEAEQLDNWLDGNSVTDWRKFE